MAVRISSEALAVVRAACAEDDTVEACGLLLGSRDAINTAVPCRNVSADPRRSFEIDPQALINAHRAQRQGGAEVMGCFHSHPGGIAEPSEHDAAMAAADGQIWLIVGANDVRAWRAGVGGQKFGKFDPVELVLC